ncbi:MAG TPA: ComF family protein [Lactobacillus sp.]|nr:ComF family protein [Lactobacillus sp.]
MMKCLLCNTTLAFDFSWRWFFSFRAFETIPLCEKCHQKFVAIAEKTSCPGCGRKQKQRKLCQDCLRWRKLQTELLYNKAFYVYAEPNMRAYFEAYKFQGDYRLRQIFVKTLQDHCKKYLHRGWSVVVIPVDEQTLATRGFDQVVGFLPDIPKKMYLYHLKKFDRCPQSHKSRQERLATPQPFGYCGPADLERKNILLVDDIYTTGSTLYHARELLLAHNCGCVRSVTLAR